MRTEVIDNSWSSFLTVLTGVAGCIAVDWLFIYLYFSHEAFATANVSGHHMVATYGCRHRPWRTPIESLAGLPRLRKMSCAIPSPAPHMTGGSPASGRPPADLSLPNAV